MRALQICCAALLTLAVAAAHATAASQDDRARVIATLEKLFATGEPLHNTHDEGEWLQRQVDAAFARGDEEIEQLARHAAVPLVACVPRPVSRTSWGPGLALLTPKVLTVPKPPEYTAEMFVSLDGGPLVHIGTVPSSGPRKIDRAVVESWQAPGLHHLRIRAQVTFDEKTIGRSASPA